MKLSEFLKESREKHAVLAFGRMNPPTVGHEALVNKVKEVARQNQASHHVVLSHTQDKAKNPLTSEQKLKHAKRFFPGTNLSVSTSEAPNFLTQAAKLHKQGVTHLHMVAGSDRVPEYEKLLHKYNGTHEGALFNFKHIKVHSAGERDPDAEGVSGMSASKMRKHASENNFKEFRKGVPQHVPEHHAKELFNHVRQGMNVNENYQNIIKENDINLDFEQILIEGVHDQSIFKAVFLAGGPGSGKDYVLDNTLDGHGLTEINSDKALEYLMDKENLDKRMPESEKEQRDFVRNKAKNITELRQRLALMGRNGLIINGTGDDPEKIKRIKDALDKLGYESSMLMVNTADEVSKQRNIERGQRGGRTVPEEIRKQKWDSVQAARPELAKIFGDKYMEFDNSEDLRSASPEVVKAKKDEMLNLYKTVQQFVKAPPQSENSKQWIASEMHKKDVLPVEKDGTEKVPHPDSNAAEEARKLGLKYYGFGRYGKDGKITHRSVHDKLVEVEKNPQKDKDNINIPISGSSMRKTPVVKEQIIPESYSLSDSSAMNLLLLGNPVDEQNFDRLQEQKHLKLLKHDDGRVMTFMLRRSAAKEAHKRNGEVMPYKNGYVVKLKEENEDEINRNFEELVWINEERTNFITESRTFEESSCQTKTTKKISLAEIRARQKENINQESIDKGIEPGVSMAGSGESIARDTGEKWSKKNGKSSQVTETIGDGGEMATSVSDQKEDELKKKGINLTSFKAKRPIG